MNALFYILGIVVKNSWFLYGKKVLNRIVNLKRKQALLESNLLSNKVDA